LAEGADRLPADIAIQRGYEVFVPVPLPLAEYERDFPESQTEFRELLARIPKENIFELPAVFPIRKAELSIPKHCATFTMRRSAPTLRPIATLCSRFGMAW
jgi:hypothetical protein